MAVAQLLFPYKIPEALLSLIARTKKLLWRAGKFSTTSFIADKSSTFFSIDGYRLIWYGVFWRQEVHCKQALRILDRDLDWKFKIKGNKITSEHTILFVFIFSL